MYGFTIDHAEDNVIAHFTEGHTLQCTSTRMIHSTLHRMLNNRH